ncbi:hypothetical protein A3A93_02475 [Candidatus Roizmanbacteria bacterium RIFCSPLOWO2_01_FULL_38_12]|uniref:Uncharacterized protein n=1 Tax=Candidatus Roizmanbacteria bacterium RIFCSPLOWO2_01_FULL_38_12 TaxID=1802061 RepID=A0A1F7J001_9BACT|nr:MAG: hypothetical protein A2861_00995 [Candidatus Roizmanbacteria bacterium RIFCSPHIGHO2_01_FULL_38_15]OGK36165.1 MAG: hypothetical protein A3F59_06215 [Candidatus Roizmanbacteria bacterium RIFCSPHIGHO2_12_FULL_38_13]OGK48933.1 MAG: hypothetical protein A3A93_02475 [Candidatus Roizmanbacteria bacterium RIFCSPLOWO2_01_FULL_38_12]
MNDKKDKLNSQSLLVIFAYAPTGFGHLRVSDALFRGLPDNISPLLVGAHDKTLSYLYRIVSVNPLTRMIFEWFEHGALERMTTPIYRWYLRSHTQILYEQLTTILDQRLTSPQTVLIIATHFGLAHQIAALKERLMSEKKIKILLAVQITDDIPHRIWYVPGADIIFVPSDRTRKKLEQYGRRANLQVVKFETNPYPTNPLLNADLTVDEIENRLSQVNIEKKSQIHMMIPISGAAVGTAPLTKLIDELYTISHRFIFHVITKNVSYTKTFVSEMLNRPYVKLEVSAIDKEVITKYINIYLKEVVSLEVTKPSEQAFKALVNTNKRGGVILLFTTPIGKQEDDNLNFMARHELIPSKSDQQKLEKMAKNNVLILDDDKKILNDAKKWRGISLPKDSHEAARFIWWCLNERLFLTMIAKKDYPSINDPHGNELAENGVEKFWQKIAAII